MSYESIFHCGSNNINLYCTCWYSSLYLIKFYKFWLKLKLLWIPLFTPELYMALITPSRKKCVEYLTVGHSFLTYFHWAKCEVMIKTQKYQKKKTRNWTYSEEKAGHYHRWYLSIVTSFDAGIVTKHTKCQNRVKLCL